MRNLFPPLDTGIYGSPLLQQMDSLMMIEQAASAGSNAAEGVACLSCGYQNRGKLKFCVNCGTPTAMGCPVCSRPIVAGSKFCGECGTHLNGKRSAALAAPPALPLPLAPSKMPAALAEKIQTAAVRTSNEQREVTVLILDFTNFTATAYHLDNEEVYLFVDEAMALLVEVLHRYEGTVDKFTGDGLMALFGVPRAHEDDPERAVRAAMEMQQSLKPLQQRLLDTYGVEFQARIGVTTGRVIAGNMGSDAHMEYMVIGDSVNLAARLESAAVPGTILVNEETYHRTRPIFEFEALPPIAAKGFPEPIPVYRPSGLLEKPGKLRGVPGLKAPLIGRTESLNQLVGTLQEMQKTSQRQTVFVTGEAGVGKSRLVSEFRATVPAAAVNVYQGACVAYDRSRPLRVIAELLKDIFKLPETGSDSVRRKLIQRHLERLNLISSDILPYINHIIGIQQADPALESRLQQLDTTMLQRQTHTALRRLLLAEAIQKPTVLIFEDLHWIDPASRDFLELLIQSSDREPLLLILISRQAERETVINPLLKTAALEPARMVDVQLTTLAEPEGQMLADQLIKQTGPEAYLLKQNIARRAAGNPFFVEEIVRMLIDQRGLRPSATGEAWEVTPKANALLKSVPGTVNGLILARFDRLPEDIRQTLQKAAVLGSAFSLALLEKLHGDDHETLAIHLDELEARHFVMAKPGKGQPVYLFQHALLQDAIYSTLLKRDRRTLHTKAGEAISSDPTWPADEADLALAYHFGRSLTPKKAIPHMIAVADRAMHQCAYEIALDHYQQVKALVSDPRWTDTLEFYKIHIGLGRALKLTGDFAGASQVVLDGIQHFWQSSLAADSHAIWTILVDSLNEIADIRQREGSYDDAITYLETGLQLLGENSDAEHPVIWCSLLDRLAWIRFRQGDLDEAGSLAGAAVRNFLNQSIDNPIRLASLYNTLGGVAWQQGRFEKAIISVEHSLQLYDQVGYLWGRSVAFANLGVLNYVQGDWAKASKYYKQAHDLQRTIGDLPHQAISLENLGLLHSAMGRHETALEELEASLALRQRLGDTWGTAQAYANLAPLLLKMGRVDEAFAHAETGLAMAEAVGSPETKIQAGWVMALGHARRGELQTGLKVAEHSLELARVGGFKEGEIDCLRVFGTLQSQAGNHTQAETLLLESISLAQAQNASYQSAQARLALGLVYQAAARTDADQADLLAKAQEHLQTASLTFTNLGAAFELNLAQTALGKA